MFFLYAALGNEQSTLYLQENKWFTPGRLKRYSDHEWACTVKISNNKDYFLLYAPIREAPAIAIDQAKQVH